MTVFSRLFRQAPPPPRTLEDRITELRTQTPESAASLALSAAEEPLRLAAIESLGIGDPLLTLAGCSGQVAATSGIRRAAQQRLAQLLDAGAVTLMELNRTPANTAAVLAVAAYSTDNKLLPQAVAEIEDESLLGELAIQGSSPAIRQLAAERVQDPALLGQLLREARGKDKNVYRIFKAKRDAQHAQQRAAEEAAAHRATLCATLERHSHQPFSGAYVAAVDHLNKEWNAVAAQSPPELQQRAEAALDRCREVITRHLQQVASEAARLAAIEQAAAQHQTILQELQELLAKVYAAAAAPADADAQLARYQTRWHDLEAIKTPGSAAHGSFRQLTGAIAAVAAFNAQHQSVLALADSLSDSLTESDAEANVAKLHRVLRHLELLADRVPESAVAAIAKVQAWEQARAVAAESQNAALRQVSALLRKAQSTLAAGHSRQAAGIRRALEERLLSLPAVPAQLTGQLQAFDARLGVLQDWRSFAVAPKRGELIGQMEALIGSPDKPRTLADKIKRLQDEWKLISKGGTEDTSAEWQRFHEAAQKAYEPCREYFTAQSAMRADNLEKRAALLARLQAFVAAQGQEQTDWREVTRALRDSQQQWRALQPVERAANRPLQESFDALITALQARLDAEYTTNVALKRALITRAQQLASSEDGGQATDEVKRLQLAWKDIGLVPHEESQRLWEEFRQYCDAIFAQRQQQHELFVSELAQNRVRAAALCEEAEQVLSLSGDELLEAARKLPGLREAFTAIGELPKGDAHALRARLDRAMERCDQQLAQQRTRAKALAWDHMLEAGDRIRRYHLAVADQAAPEVCTARNAEAQAFIDGFSQWPKGALRALQAALASAGTGTGVVDKVANEAALRTLCIRAELLTDTPTPAGDQALRRDYQLRQLMKGLGQARPSVREELDALVFEWIAVGATEDAVHAELLQRFRRCRS